MRMARARWRRDSSVEVGALKWLRKVEDEERTEFGRERRFVGRMDERADVDILASDKDESWRDLIYTWGRCGENEGF